MTGVQPIVASYTCHEGATLVGSEMRICQEDGSWSGEEPFCKTGMMQTVSFTKVTGEESYLLYFAWATQRHRQGCIRHTALFLNGP